MPQYNKDHIVAMRNKNVFNMGISAWLNLLACGLIFKNELLNIMCIEFSLFILLILILGVLTTLTIFSIFNYHNIKRKTKIILLEKFGVFWDSEYKMRCLKCNNFLKNSSVNGSTFFCVKCGEKYFLNDGDGNPMTKNDAINKIKTLKTIT